MYAWLAERIPADKFDQFEHELQSPLPWQEKKVTPMQADDEGESFMALLAEMSG